MHIYENPELKINRFETEDILTASSADDGLASATIYGGEASWKSDWELTDIQ